MFMFWSKRTVLTRRLLKAKVRGEHETECEAQEDSSRIHRTIDTTGAGNDTSGNVTTTAPAGQTSSTRGGASSSSSSSSFGGKGQRGGGGGGGGSGAARTSSSSSTSSRLHQGCCGGDQSYDDDEYPSRLLRCKELLKTLKENQLEMLLTAVESCGADLGSCILVPRQQRPFRSSSDSDSEIDDQQRQSDNQQLDQQYHRPPPPHHRHQNHLHHHHHHNHHHNNLRYHRRRRRSPENGEYLQVQQQQQQQQQHSSNSNSPEEQSSSRKRYSANNNRVPVRGSLENTSMDPLVLCCQIWRWPDLVPSEELKRLPICHSAKDPVYVCCNPYHWSRLCKPESPPPPYCLIADRLRPEDRAPSEGDQRRCKSSTPLPLPGSLTTNGEGETDQKEWCTLAYWELGGRVGRLYPVEPLTVNVFDSLHDGNGLCLATLAENHVAPPSVQKTRSKIGLGIMLSQEADGVWAYNRSESPIFVNSPTLDDPESRTLLVYRVPPGFCLNIFDRAKVLQLPSSYTGPGCNSRNNNNAASGFSSGPVDINSVRISFAKGWGPKYSRQEVTSCPCWLEVLLAPCR